MSFGTGKIWMNGSLVDWADAKIHIASHVIHYGTGVFEGARCYSTPKGSACFRLDTHVIRLLDSAKIYRMDSPLDQAGWENAILDTIRANEPKACYIRPLMYRGYNQLGVNPLPCPVDTAVLVWEWGAYLGPERRERRRRARQLVEPHGAEHVPGRGQGDGQLRQLDADQDGGDARRLRRGHRARREGLRQRGLRPEPVPRAQQRHLHAAGPLVDSRRHHARLDHHDRARTRLRRARGGDAARDALPGRRGVLLRHGRGGDADPVHRQDRRSAPAGGRSPRPSAGRSSTSSTASCPTATAG